MSRLLLLIVFLAPFSHAFSQETDKKGKIWLAVSIIWEGESMNSENLKTIEQLKKDIPQLKLIHFISPAYFFKNRENQKEIIARLREVIAADDHVALSLHGWQSIAAKSGVVFRNSPTFWGNRLTKEYCANDCGHEVPLSVYSKQDIRKMLLQSFTFFEVLGFKKPVSFIAGGWMASRGVREAIVAEGIKYDFSPVPPEVVKDQLFRYPLYQWVKDLWPGITTYSQPSLFQTSGGTLIEVPSNGVTTEYVNSQRWLDIYKHYAQLWLESNENDFYMSVGTYQETAAKSIHKIRSFLTNLDIFSKSKNIPYEFVDLNLRPDILTKMAEANKSWTNH